MGEAHFGNTNQLKMKAHDGKMRDTDVASIEAQTGKPIISSKNAIDFSRLIADVIEGKDEK